MRQMRGVPSGQATTDRQLRAPASAAARYRPRPVLTRRQREVSGLLARGLTNAEIAEQLVLSTGTVANHVASILQRLNVETRTQVATWAVEHGLHGHQDQLLTTLETLLELEPSSVRAAIEQAAQLVAEALEAAAVVGYLHQPEATRLSLEPDGWLHTGDVGYADAQGYLFIVDRVKEIIKYKAYQVAPAELEAVLMTHPGVVDAAVVPVPDPESGEIPKALVVRSAEDVQPDELLAYVAERVAPYKKVRRIEFVESIPKSASGKILRRLLVERERAAAAQSAQAS